MQLSQHRFKITGPLGDNCDLIRRGRVRDDLARAVKNTATGRADQLQGNPVLFGQHPVLVRIAQLHSGHLHPDPGQDCRLHTAHDQGPPGQRALLFDLLFWRFAHISPLLDVKRGFDKLFAKADAHHPYPRHRQYCVRYPDPLAQW